MKTEINNNKLYATINSKGAELKGLRDLHGMEYIWPGDDIYWSHSSPILFPIVGAVRNDKYIYGGKEYTISKHGFCRTADFRKVDGRTDAVTFHFASNEETKKQYPFDFELYISYELVDFSIVVKYKIINKDEKPMPFFIGGHPAVRIPLEQGEKITDYCVKFPFAETVGCPAVTSDCLIDNTQKTPFLNNQNSFMLKHEYFKIDALIFDELKSRSVEVYSIETGRGVRMDFDGFDYFAIWQPNKKGAPFICLEPWTGSGTLTTEGDEIEGKRGVKTLNSGESFEIQYKLTVI